MSAVRGALNQSMVLVVCSLPRKRVGVGVSALFTLPLCTYVLTVNNSHPEHIYMNMYIDQHTDY